MGVFKLLMKKEQTNETEKDSRKNRQTGGLQLKALPVILLKSHSESSLKNGQLESSIFHNPPGFSYQDRKGSVSCHKNPQYSQNTRVSSQSVREKVYDG